MSRTEQSSTAPEVEWDEVTGARILSGHLLTWNDTEHVGRPTAVAAVVEPLVRETSPQRVLLVGPRAVPLVALLPDEVVVDTLVRGVPDAGEASDASGLHDRAQVHCGGLDAFDAEAPYDLVVALGGPTRLIGPDSEGIGHQELVRRLAELVADEGTLVFDVANGLGLDALTAAAPAAAADSNDLWHAGAVGYDVRPPVRAEVTAMTAAAGLDERRTFAALPSMDHSGLLVAVGPTAPALDDEARTRVRQAVVAAARPPVTATLRDPGSVAAVALDADALELLAPAWLLVTTKGTDAPPLDEVPTLVDTEPFLSPRWSRVVVMDARGRTTVAWADGRDEETTAERALSRTLSVPHPASGTPLETALRDACAVRHHAAIRDLVVRYHAWLSDPAAWAGEAGATQPFAVPANVAVLDDGSLGVIDSSWRLTHAVDPETVLVLGLRTFARDLLAAAAPHPWRTDSTPDVLTYTLAAMAGLVPAPESITAAAHLESVVEALRTGRPDRVTAIEDSNLRDGRTARNLPAASASGFRELLMRDRRQARHLRERDAQVAWLEGTLRHRDRYIRELEALIERYEATLTYKTVQAIRAPRRVVTTKAVATAKETVKEALPPGALDRARSFAKKRLS